MPDLGVLQNARAALVTAPFKAVVAVGVDNVQYLTGLTLPFLYSHTDWRVAVVLSPDRDEVVICPFELEGCFNAAERRYIVQPYDAAEGGDGFLQTLERILDQIMPGGQIAFDMSRLPHSLLERMARLRDRFVWISGDAWLGRLRMIKTSPEIQLLEDVASRTDHAILGASHHVMINLGRTEKFVSEDVRVHALERFLDASGYNAMSQVAAGTHSQKFWPLAPRYGMGLTKTLDGGALVRVELQATLNGYWASGARMIAMGEPSAQQRLAYDSLVLLRDSALEIIKPGTVCHQIWQRIIEVSEREGINLVKNLRLGHGVGVTPFEPPFVSRYDETELTPNMIFVLDPIVRGPEGELLRSKDTILVTQDGYRILGWYKDWREPYIAPYAL